jgi:hypothetical protein
MSALVQQQLELDGGFGAPSDPDSRAKLTRSNLPTIDKYYCEYRDVARSTTVASGFGKVHAELSGQDQTANPVRRWSGRFFNAELGETMPQAKIATKQAKYTLEQLHAELGGKIFDNKREDYSRHGAIAASLAKDILRYDGLKAA